MTAPAKRTRGKLLLALLSMLLVASSLVYALPDSTPAAEAHDLTTTRKECVQSPFGELCLTVTDKVPHIHCWNGAVLAVGETCPQKPKPKPTAEPCGFLSHRDTPDGECHSGFTDCPGGERVWHHDTCPKPPKPAQCTPGVGEHKHTLFNNQVTCHAGDHSCPTGQHLTSSTAHGHVSGCHSTTNPAHSCPTGQHPTSTEPWHGHVSGCHSTTNPAHSCPTGQNPASTTAHGHVSGCAAPPAQCTPKVGEHKHTLFNNQVTCHSNTGPAHQCPDGQHATSTTTDGHVSGCHSTTDPAHVCPGNQVPTSTTAHGHVSGCKTVQQPQCTPGPGQHKHTLALNRNQTYCHAGSHSCPDGQHHISKSAHGHVSGCHSTTNPAHSCPGNQVAGSRTAHGHVSGCKTVQPAQCTPGPGQHKHTLFNNQATCHAGSHFCPTGQHHISKSAHGHVSGCHSETNPAHSCPGDHVAGSRTSDGHVSSCYPRTAVTQDPKPCAEGQHQHMTTPTNLPIVEVQTGEYISPADPDFDARVTWGGQAGEWEPVPGRPTCYNAVLPNNGKTDWKDIGTFIVDVGSGGLDGLKTAGIGFKEAFVAALESYGETEKERVEGYVEAGKVYRVILCNPWGALGAANGAGHLSGTLTKAAGAKISAAAAGTIGGVVIGGSIIVLCWLSEDAAAANQADSGPSALAFGGVPAPVTELSASAGDKQITVAWAASATKAAAGFGYRMQWKLASQTWNQAKQTDLEHAESHLASAWVIAELANGSAYDVRVAAYNTGGPSDWVSVRATPTAPNIAAPAPPSRLSASGGDKQVAVSWTASTTTPAAGFGYRVQWKLTGQTWDQAAANIENLDYGSDLATSHTITGLVNGSAYDVRVAAFNTGGLSQWVSGRATPVAPEPPAAASALQLTAGDGQVAVSWTASTTTPAAGFGYRVQWKAITDTWATAAANIVDLDHGSDLATSHTITGLVNGSTYNVRVAAFNTGGFSPWISANDASVSPKPSAPAAASGLQLTAGDGQVAVSWTDSPSAPAISGYRVQWKLSTQSWSDVNDRNHYRDLWGGSNAPTSHTITGLANGSAYDVRVAAFNTGALSEWITDTATPAAPKPKPAAAASGLKLTAGDKQVAVSWTASTTTPAAGFGYRVQWKLAGQTWDQAAANIVDLDHGSDLATSHTITGLVNGSAYDVRVAAFNAVGLSEWVTDTATPAAPKPQAAAAASGLKLETNGGLIAVSWTASATTPAAGFGYRVQWKLTGQTWDQAAANIEDLDHGSDLATSHTITGLVNGSAYDVRVAAFNAVGLSEWITDTATPRPFDPERDCYRYYRGVCYNIENGRVVIYNPPSQ